MGDLLNALGQDQRLDLQGQCQGFNLLPQRTMKQSAVLHYILCKICATNNHRGINFKLTMTLIGFDLTSPCSLDQVHICTIYKIKPLDLGNQGQGLMARSRSRP